MENGHLPKNISDEMEQQLSLLQHKLEELRQAIQEKECCILNDFEEANNLFTQIHNRAATFYLQLYLEPYTEFMEMEH